MVIFLTKSELKQIISDCWNEVLFQYNDKPCGISAEVENSVPTYEVWHGNDIMYYSDVDELMSDKFYSGKSINELVGLIEFQIL